MPQGWGAVQGSCCATDNRHRDGDGSHSTQGTLGCVTGLGDTHGQEHGGSPELCDGSKDTGGFQQAGLSHS